MITSHQSIVKFDTFNTNGTVKLTVKNVLAMTSLRLCITTPTGETLVHKFPCKGKNAKASFVVENPLLWSVSHPNLYRYVLTITFTDGLENIEGTFGFRTISHDQNNVTLNGEPIYVKGYIRGAAAHEHPNLLGVSQKDFYRKNISQAKSFGFNLIRFHSVVPPQELFEVADEVGMLIHLELRMPNDDYNNLEEMLYSKKELIPNEFITKTIDELYNHPSLAVYCIGNEIKNLAEGSRVLEIGNLIKTGDPSRLYLDTCAWGEAGRPLVDIDVQHMGYYFPYGKHDNMFSDTDNLLVVGNSQNPLVTSGTNSSAGKVINHNVPLIAHEVCHYVALRPFAKLRQKFLDHNQPLPWWIDEELKLIEQKGHSANFDKMFLASKHFQHQCWKVAFENMRASKILGGFHFLQFADTERYENSNGVVDCFDDTVYLTPEQFLTFNGDDVLLCDIDNFVIEGDVLNTKISLSRYSESTVKVADLSYSLVADDKILCQGVLPQISVGKRDLYDICKLKLQIPNLGKPSQLTLSVKLTSENQVFSQNSWNLWHFPKQQPLSYSEFVNYNKKNVFVTDNVERALSLLKKGKKVCLAYRSDWTRHLLDKQMPAPKYAFRATWNRFKPVIWDRGTNLGGLANSQILNKHGFVTQNVYDFNYSILTEDCDKIILDDFPTMPEILLQGIDKHCRDRFDAYKVSFNLPELMPDRTLRNFGYLFQVKVGKGSLLVCGLNMTGLNQNEPSTIAMARCILSYISSDDFAPTAKISLDEFKSYMTKCAQKPVKERMMTQYWELDSEPVESKQYWTESRAYLTEK